MAIKMLSLELLFAMWTQNNLKEIKSTVMVSKRTQNSIVP